MELFVVLLNLAAIIALPVLGFVCGSVAESRHYRSIRERESRWLDKPALTCRTPLDDSRTVARAEMAVGSVVVSVDYFKRILAQLRLFFGGELGAYASLVDRGKREAILRMREACPNADAYLNVRLQTSSLSRGERQMLGSVEVVAYGTAVTYAHGLHPEEAREDG